MNLRTIGLAASLTAAAALLSSPASAGTLPCLSSSDPSCSSSLSTTFAGLDVLVKDDIEK